MIRIAPFIGAVFVFQVAGPAFAAQDAGVSSGSSGFEQYPAPSAAELEAQKKREEAERRAREELQRKQVLQLQRDEQKQREEERTSEKSEEKKEEEKKSDNKPEPSLNLPIGLYVWAAIFGGLGAVTGILSSPLERDLRDPGKHRTPETTQWIYDRARATGFISKGFYGLAGLFTGWAGFRTTGAIQDYMKAKAGLSQVSDLEKDSAFALTPSPDETPLSAESEPSFLISPFGLELRF